MRPSLPFLLLCAPVLFGADASGRIQLEPGGFPSRGWGASITGQAALPLGTLSRDVRDHVGFGLGVHAVFRIAEHQVISPGFEWTGYRISDRTWASRFLASLLDADYSEDSMTLRSYKFGADYQLFQRSDLTGPYLLGGGGLQRSRLYLEHTETTQNPDGTTSSSTQDLGTTDPLNTLYLEAGAGYQWTSGGLVEVKYTNWRYRANPGAPLADSLSSSPTGAREAHSLTFSAGIRF